jgi:integrase
MKIKKVFRKDLGEYRWKIDVTVDGQRIRRADFEKKQDAIDAIAALHSKARSNRYGLTTPKPKITLNALQNSLTKDQARKPDTLRIFKEFVELINGETLLLDLGRSDWKTYTDLLRARDCKPGTINRYMAEVSSVLSSAVERFPDLGDWRPPAAPWLPYPLGRDRVLSRGEISQILMALRAKRQHYEQSLSVNNRAEVLDLFRLMLLTGAREGEILGLRQGQISWDWRTVRIESKKGGGSLRVVPLSDFALSILTDRQDRGQKLFDLGRDRLYRTLNRVSESSGVIYGDNVEGGWVLHDLRHVAATVMENAGIPYSAVAAILGHKRKDQTATYAHAQLETLRRGVETLETWCREIDGFFGVRGQNQTSTDLAHRVSAK